MNFLMRPATVTGRCALVTGAASGIGAALCRALLASGNRVVAIDRDWSDRVEPTFGESFSANVRLVTLDVRRNESWQALARELDDAGWTPEILINNAGVGVAGAFEATTLDDWDRLIDVNLKGVVYGIQAFYSGMRERGHGHIVNVASGAALCPRPGMAAYAATKAAVFALSNALRAEAAVYHVGVTVVCPGYIGTRIMENTGFRGVDGAAMQRSIPIRPTSADACAARILKAVSRNEGVVTVGPEIAIEWMLNRLSPSLAGRVARWRAAQFRRFATTQNPQ
ncbi:MAG: SDR family NAD(P)-dependent oxidoreductase [Myxococcales bacterium]|nr:SDR family NAD(P)-dependent oxidoreductase [Myxococcales bacterium]